MLADLGLTRRDMKYVDMEWRFEYPAKAEQDDAGFYLVTFAHFPEAATLLAAPEDRENDFGER